MKMRYLVLEMYHISPKNIVGEPFYPQALKSEGVISHKLD